MSTKTSFGQLSRGAANKKKLVIYCLEKEKIMALCMYLTCLLKKTNGLGLTVQSVSVLLSIIVGLLWKNKTLTTIQMEGETRAFYNSFLDKWSISGRFFARFWAPKKVIIQVSLISCFLWRASNHFCNQGTFQSTTLGGSSGAKKGLCKKESSAVLLCV